MFEILGHATDYSLKTPKHQQSNVQCSQQVPLSVCSPALLESSLIKTEQVDPEYQSWLSHNSGGGGISSSNVSQDDSSFSRSLLLPSFPESFKPEVNLIPAPEESLDDLDEEIKMIVARAEHREGLLTFLEEQDLEAQQQEDPGFLSVDFDKKFENDT